MTVIKEQPDKWFKDQATDCIAHCRLTADDRELAILKIQAAMHAACLSTIDRIATKVLEVESAALALQEAATPKQT